MLLFLKLAWRNIFRNKRRTIIASLAIGIGLAALVFISAVMRGMTNHMIQSATDSFLGEAQIHGQGFRETQEVEKTINNLEQVISDLKKENTVDKFTLRTINMAMITSPANVNAILLVGVEAETEQYLSKIDNAIIEGDFFSGSNRQDIVIGRKLAEILEVTLGDKLQVTVSKAETGELAQELFRVSGIYSFDVRELDTGMAYIRLKKAREMLGLGNRVHEIALKFKDDEMALRKEHSFWNRYSQKGNETVSWIELLPQMKAVFDMSGISLFVMVVILGVVVTFGIINTLFMSLYERMFEFGVLRALGTRSSGMRKLVIFEATALALVSIVIGIILGLGITFLVSKTGIDYRGIEFAGTTIHDLLYPEISFWDFLYFPLGVMAFTLIVGLYPAIVAGRMKIADALRKSL
jgi:ABC-type lipoprotein release transport system permease subunit